MGVFGVGALGRNSGLDSAEGNHIIPTCPTPHSLRQEDDPFRVSDKEELVGGGRGMGLLRPDRDAHVKGEIPDWQLTSGFDLSCRWGAPQPRQSGGR